MVLVLVLVLVHVVIRLGPRPSVATHQPAVLLPHLLDVHGGSGLFKSLWHDMDQADNLLSHCIAWLAPPLPIPRCDGQFTPPSRCTHLFAQTRWARMR